MAKQNVSPSRMTRLLSGTLIAGASLTSVAVASCLLAAADAAAITIPATSAPPSPNVASLPAAVQPFVKKIEQVAVNSERYSLTLGLSGPVTSYTRGHRKHTKHASASLRAVGEASLSPLVGKLYERGGSGQLASVGVGPTVFDYSRVLARTHKDRPWVRADKVSAAVLFPFHGGVLPSSLQLSAGGSGSYAELVDLLATGGAEVRVAGTATIEGQPTTELTAQVRPGELLRGGSQGEKQEISETLEVFVSESGLPLRVSRVERTGSLTLTETIDILALDVPVSVAAPPAAWTIGAARARKRLAALSSGEGPRLPLVLTLIGAFPVALASTSY
jgi:hypothetical protein